METRHATDPVSGETVSIRNDLVRRLRGEYACGPTMPNGEPEFGWRTFGEPIPIQLEAATELSRLRERLRVLEEALGELTKAATGDVGAIRPGDITFAMLRRARTALKEEGK